MATSNEHKAPSTPPNIHRVVVHLPPFWPVKPAYKALVYQISTLTKQVQALATERPESTYGTRYNSQN